MQNQWKKFLFEEVERQNVMEHYQFFCDLDGCLTNFMDAVIKHLNRQMQNASNIPQNSSLYKALEKAAVHLGGTLENPPNINLASLEKTPGTNNPVRSLSYFSVQNDKNFWNSLEWMPDGKELWEYYSRFNPIILSAPMKEPSEVGKREWCKRELNLPDDRIILTQNKFQYANYNGKIGFLVDDMPKYLDPFIKNGGQGILHKSAASTIRELQKQGVK